MKRFVVFVVFVLWSGVLAYGAAGSAAWFTDTEKVPVSAAAASLNIQVENLTDGGIADDENGTIALTHVMTGMIPGEAYGPLMVRVTNIGDMPAWLKLSANKTGGSNNIYNNLTIWAAKPTDCGNPLSGGSQIYGGPIGQMSTSVPTWNDPVFSAATFEPGETACIHFEFRIEDTATDSGGTAMFNIVFKAGQENDPAYIP